MIEKIVLKDFQIHRSLEVLLDPHLTTFVAPSDKGKSSLLRALKWLLLNQPSGEEFIARFGKAAYARVHVIIDKKFIGRMRGSGDNLYRLGKEVFRSFGQGGVPEPIQRIVNVSEVNFQSQHSAPFWFTESPGQVSQQLNSIINLGAIDATLAHAAKTVRRSRAAVDVSQDRLRAAKDRKAKLAWAIDLDTAVGTVEGISDSLLTAQEQRRMALESIESIETAVKAKIRLEEGLALGSVAIQAGYELIKATEYRDQLGSMLTKLDQLSQVSKVNIPDLGEIERLHNRVLKIKRRKQSLENLLLSLAQVEHQQCLAEGFLIDAIKDLKKATKGVCPVCQRPIPKL